MENWWFGKWFRKKVKFTTQLQRQKEFDKVLPEGPTSETTHVG